MDDARKGSLGSIILLAKPPAPVRTARPAPSEDAVGGNERAVRLLLFLVPLVVGVEIGGLGTLYLSELCLLALLPVLLVLRGRALLMPDAATVCLLCLFYLGAQAVTDVVRAAAFEDYARGWSRILFLLLNFVALHLLIAGQRGRMVVFAWGLVAGHLIDLARKYPIEGIGWKFGLAGPVTAAVCLLCAAVPLLRSPRSLAAPLLLAALGALSMWLAFRSWGGVLFLAAAFLAMPVLLRWAGRRPRALSPGRLALLGLLLALATIGTLKLYGHAARAGWLGDAALAKYEAQAALGDLGLLLGGRSEVLVSIRAIQDSPFLGHGSWAQDRRYAELQQDLLRRLGFTDQVIEPESDLIPTHSHLLGSWVEAGLAGALFWLGVLGLIAGGLRRLYANDDPLRPYCAFLLILFVWDILFSPFGAYRRLGNAFLLVVVLYCRQLGQGASFAPAPAFAQALADPAHGPQRRRPALPGPDCSDDPAALAVRAGFRRLRQGA